MLFVGYNRVHFSQYELYEKYAAMTPGADALDVARDIYSIAPMKDAVAPDFRYKFADLLRTHGGVRIEFHLFSIPTADGDGFDIYLVDEDGLFLGVAVDVAEADIITAATALLDAQKYPGKLK